MWGLAYGFICWQGCTKIVLSVAEIAHYKTQAYTNSSRYRLWDVQTYYLSWCSTYNKDTVDFDILKQQVYRGQLLCFVPVDNETGTWMLHPRDGHLWGDKITKAIDIRIWFCLPCLFEQLTHNIIFWLWQEITTRHLQHGRHVLRGKCCMCVCLCVCLFACVPALTNTDAAAFLDWKKLVRAVQQVWSRRPQSQEGGDEGRCLF